jgi:hypothetical protein
MEEARQVIERLARIEELKRGGSSPSELLAELRTLLREGEAWLAAEPAGTERARDALRACEVRLDLGKEGAETYAIL